MDRLILPKQLEDCQRVLIAGAGGGFDVYAGLPIYHRLRAMGKNVSLANLSFTNLENTTAVRIGPGLYTVERLTSGEESYLPERSLCRFLERRCQESVVVYAIENTGAKPVREAYATLARDLELDAVVLIDGGTDILLRGDEAGFLGAMALLSSMPEVEFYLDAIRDADLTTIKRPSIVNGSIASALEGRFGYHRAIPCRRDLPIKKADSGPASDNL